MKKIYIISLVVLIAALSVMSVSAAPRAGYYDQVGNKHWCNSDSYGCWVAGEDGGKDYIMFWSESAREAIMGPNSNAPIGTLPGTSEMNLAAPAVESAGPVDKCAGVNCEGDNECNPSTGKCVCAKTDQGCKDEGYARLNEVNCKCEGVA